MNKIYVRMTKKIIEGETQGCIRTDLIEVESEKMAKKIIAREPVGSKSGGIFQPRFEILAHDYVIE